MYKIADLNISPGHNLLKDPEKVLPTSQVFFYSLKMRSSFPKTNIRRIENILIKAVWQNNIELVKTNYRDIILNKAVKLSGIFRGKIDASMRTTCKISVTTKVRLPVCIMKANSSIEWHPVRYRLFIRIGSICCHFTSQHRRTAL